MTFTYQNYIYVVSRKSLHLISFYLIIHRQIILIMEQRRHRLKLRVAFKLLLKERRDLTRLKQCSKRMKP